MPGRSVASKARGTGGETCAVTHTSVPCCTVFDVKYRDVPVRSGPGFMFSGPGIPLQSGFSFFRSGPVRV